MGIRYVRDLAPASWIASRLHRFAQDVGSVIPIGFDAYARLLHPALRSGSPVSWRAIAQASGRTVHAEMQFGNIAGAWRRSPRLNVWTVPPRQGTLPRDHVRALVGVLREHTKTPDTCWFAIWEGWGGLNISQGLPKFELPHRSYFLASGTVDDALVSVNSEQWAYQSASMWWPEDRSWFVSTEIDFPYTYVGGTEACIEMVIVDPAIEALRARLGDGVTYDSDRLNPPVPMTT